MAKFCSIINNIFDKYIYAVDQIAEIQKLKDKPLRFNVWATEQSHVKNLFKKNGIKDLPATEGMDNSPHVITKIKNAVRRVNESEALDSAEKFMEDIIGSDDNIELSIALHEIMESVKGESDKARNLGIDIVGISKTSVLPVVPMSRVAASIGRKIVFQTGHRFRSNKKNRVTSADIETLYYTAGKMALEMLAEKKYISINDTLPSIKDYLTEAELRKESANINAVTKKGKEVRTVALNEKKLGIKAESTANYFLNRTESDLADTKLGVIADALRAVREITQPSTIVNPHTEGNIASEEDLRDLDDDNVNPDPISDSVRQELYKNPLYVNNSIHGLMGLLNREVKKTGDSGSKIMRSLLGTNSKGLIDSLFGIKRSDDFSKDKKESIAGQNLSKTTPLDDLAENYDVIQGDGANPVGLHLPMKQGRNIRFYYHNSVLNPHGSKHSRYTLTSGKYTVDMNSADFKKLVHGISEAIGDSKLTLDNFVGKTDSKLNTALKVYEDYKAYINKGSLSSAVAEVGKLAKIFPGTDYVSLLTGLQAVQDIRTTPVNGKITTEFLGSSDATASGGTQTFMQALGTKESVTKFLRKLGMLKNADGNAEVKMRDLYAIMENGIKDFIAGKSIEGLSGQELKVDKDEKLTGSRLLMAKTVELLFDNGDNLRNLAKDPTMVFVYKQREFGAVDTMARNLADRIVDNLNSKKVRSYLSTLLDDTEYDTADIKDLNSRTGLYQKIVTAVKDTGLTSDLYNILKATVDNQYLEHYNSRLESVWKFVEDLDLDTNFKILPAGAVLSGKENNINDLKQFGMPISKVHEIAHEVGDTGDVILTREQKLAKSVAEVSTVHSIDSAQLYHALDRVMKKPEFKGMGAVVVHDEVRGPVSLVRAVEVEYRNITKEITQKYDIHQQILLAVAAYNPEVVNDPKYKALMTEINGHVEEKNKIISNSFNEDTDALIGDNAKIKEFAGEVEVETKKETKQETKPETKKEKSTPAKKALSILEDLAGESEIIAKFLKSVNSSKIEMGDDNKFYSGDDQITISGTDIGRGAGESLDMSKPGDRKLQKELIEHEITHANTVALIAKELSRVGQSETKRELQYFNKAIENLNKLLPNIIKNSIEGNLNDETYDRVTYVLNQKNEADKLAEFIAIMTTEPEVAADIYKMLSKENPNLLERIKAFINKVKTEYLGISAKDLDNEIDVEKLYGALVNTVATGETQREQQYAEAKVWLSAYKRNYGAGNTEQVKANEKRKGKLNYLNYTVASMMNSKLEKNGQRLIGKLHDTMKSVFPMYFDVANKINGIYDSSEALQQFYNTVTGEGSDKVLKADLLAQAHKLMAQQTAITNDQMGKFNELLGKMSAKEKATIGRFVNEMPLHDYFVLADEFKTEEAIATEVTKLEKKIRKLKQKEAINDVDSLIAWNVLHDEDTKGTIYNLETKYPISDDSDFGILVRKLLALKSIQAIEKTEEGSGNFEKLLENTDLVNLLKDTSVANKLSLLENNGTGRLTDSGVANYWKEPFVTEVIELSDLKRYENGENTGWKVLRHPTTNSLGVVYKYIIDSTNIGGAYTDVKLKSADITVTGTKMKYKELVDAPDKTRKLRLTTEEKTELGLVDDFSQNLVRSTSHSMAIQDSQILRDGILRKETRMVIGKNVTELVDTIKAENVHSPWFVQFEGGVSWEDIDPSRPDLDEATRKQYKMIRAKYKPVGNRASNVKGFDKEIHLVKKDIAHWLMGGSSQSLFSNPKYKWAARVVKDLIAASKISMVVLNPLKIINDNISNIAYIGVMGASPLFIAKNYKDITRDFQEYSDLQRQIVQLKVQMVARPNSKKLEKKVEALRKQVDKNPLAGLQDRGFINSLGSDLVAKNADTLSGLQADIHSALEYLLVNKKGNKRYISHFIAQLHSIGGNGEDFLKYLGSLAKKAGKDGKGAAKELDQVYDRLKEIRTDEDIVNYVSQYTTSPGAETVRIGSSITDLTDVLAKETLYRHLMENENMSSEDARIKVLDSFPDYKENMPITIKELSNNGIIMFPSFWLRIQKVIYHTVKDKPINLATEMLLQDMVGSNLNTIMGANVVNKYNEFGGIFHTPFEPMSLATFVPVNLFKW